MGRYSLRGSSYRGVAEVLRSVQVGLLAVSADEHAAPGRGQVSCILCSYLLRCPNSIPPLPKDPFPLNHVRLHNTTAVTARGSSSSAAPPGCTSACQGQESESDLNFLLHVYG